MVAADYYDDKGVDLSLVHIFLSLTKLQTKDEVDFIYSYKFNHGNSATRYSTYPKLKIYSQKHFLTLPETLCIHFSTTKVICIHSGSPHKRTRKIKIYILYIMSRLVDEQKSKRKFERCYSGSLLIGKSFSGTQSDK